VVSDLLKYDSTVQLSPEARLRQAFDIADQDLHVPKLLDADDVAAGQADELGVATYVAKLRAALLETAKVAQTRHEAKAAMDKIQTMIFSPAINRFCDVQLRINEANFDAYCMTNCRLEEAETTADQTDFYTVAKVDTHLHLSALMTSPELFDYIREVYKRDGANQYDKTRTIAQLMEECGYQVHPIPLMTNAHPTND